MLCHVVKPSPGLIVQFLLAVTMGHLQTLQALLLHEERAERVLSSTIMVLLLLLLSLVVVILLLPLLRLLRALLFELMLFLCAPTPHP